MTYLARLTVASIALLTLPSCLLQDEAPPARSATGLFLSQDAASIRLAEELTWQHLARAEPALVDSLELRRVEIDERGHAFTRLHQTVSGIPVLGAQAIVKIDPDGAEAVQVDKLVRDLRVDTAASIDAAEAASIASRSLGLPAHAPLAAAPRPELQILVGHGEPRLAYRVELELDATGVPHRPVVFVDARTGAVVWSYDNLQTARYRKLHDLGHGTQLPGPVVRIEGGPATGDVVVDTHYALLGSAHACFQGLYGRDSFDGAGAKLISSVHYGTSSSDAFWNGTQLVFGDGDGANSLSPALAMDLTAHELMHAVTQYTSHLIYTGEPGALNESMSDIFGNVCEWYRDNNGNLGAPAEFNHYLVGNEIWLPGPAIRYMSDPAIDGSSLDFWTPAAGTDDVHHSSGIANLAFYLLAEGGTHPREKSSTVVSGIGIRDAAAIFYRANTLYLTPLSTFADARSATLHAAADLFGASSAQVAQTRNAWTAVGVL
jgi:Zn-dependent metalloprotease